MSQEPVSHESRARGVGVARRLRRDATWAERKLWARLRNRQLIGAKFRRQQPVGPYVLDCYCAEKLLDIELDGDQHGRPEGIVHDRQREEYLQRLGIVTVRFWNHEVTENIEGVLETIRHALERPSGDTARSQKPRSGAMEGLSSTSRLT